MPIIEVRHVAGALDRARILGGAMRVAYMFSAAMPDILPRVPLRVDGERLLLSVPKDLAPLAEEMKRLKG